MAEKTGATKRRQPVKPVKKVAQAAAPKKVRAARKPKQEAPVADVHEEGKKIVGAVLIEAIQKRGIELRLNNSEAATQLGISYTYFSALLTGRRPISQLHRDVLKRIAAFLRVPLVQVLIWAEVISIEDFSYHETLEEELEVSYAKMVRDPHWGGIVPVREVWETTPVEARLAIILLYEKIAEKRLLEKVKVGRIVDKPLEPVAVKS